VDVELSRGGEADEQAIRNLFTAYFYEMAAWDPGILMNEYGLPVWHEFEGDEPWASAARTPEEQAARNWWIRDRCVRYAVRAGGAAVGFALVCEDLSLLPYPVPAESEFEILDFYVAPKVRRTGVGARAAALVLERHRGNGFLFTLEANTRAQAFWRATLARCARDVVEHDGGTMFTFRS
jgi:predicted acetyltransferase